MQTVPVQVHWGLVGTIAMKLQYQGDRPIQVTIKGGSTVRNLRAGQICDRILENRPYGHKN